MRALTLNELLEAKVWSEISFSHSISLDMLEKYAEKLDWKGISQNGSIPWTIDALQKFADRIDWNEFSQHCSEHLISSHFLQKFGDRLNLEKLSQHRIFENMVNSDNNSGLLETLWDLLEKFADKVNWSEIIRHSWMFQKPQVFRERFRRYIPIGELQDSSLWDSRVDTRAEPLWPEMGGEKGAEF